MDLPNTRLALAVLAVLPPTMEPFCRAAAVDFASQVHDGYIDTFNSGPKNYVKAALDVVASFDGGVPYNWVVDWLRDNPNWMSSTILREGILGRARGAVPQQP